MLNFKFLPSTAYFTMPMGILALGLSVHHLQDVWGFESYLPQALMLYGSVSLLVVSLVYLLYWFHPQKSAPLKREWQHPLFLSFVPAATLSYLLLLVVIKVLFGGSQGLIWAYYAVALIHTFLVFKLISHWLFVQVVDIKHLKPTWFIMLSANFVVVIAGERILQSNHNEFLWFYFSISILLWLVFAIMLLYRLIFDQPLQTSMRPSLFIFMAPPSLGLIASVLMYDDQQLELSPLVIWSFYSFASMFFIYWIFAAKHFIQVDISMASWSYVYPTTAFGVANQFMYAVLNLDLFLYLSVAIFILNLFFVLVVSVWMLKQARLSWLQRFESL